MVCVLDQQASKATNRRCKALMVSAAMLAVGCGGGQPASRAPSRAVLRAGLSGSPPVLASLHAQANQLLGGGVGAFKARLTGLRGDPVVVNVWASWCGPCRAEFPLFQVASARLGRRVAFLGVDTLDSAGDARSFLAKLPVSYPSYQDPSAAIARSLAPTQGVPITVFINAAGRTTYFHQGAYPAERDLIGDIGRYAMAGGANG